MPDIDTLRDTAKLFRITKPKNPHRRSLGPQLIGQRAILIPLISEGNDLTVKKAPQLGTPFLVFCGQVTVV